MPRPLVERNCANCEKQFKSRRPEAKWCSKACVFAATRGPEFNRQLARKHNPPRNRASRGTGKKHPYVKRDGRHEHRIVAEEKLGRPLKPGEIVHHIDENGKNNDPDNLLVMSQADHARLHNTGRKRKNG